MSAFVNSITLSAFGIQYDVTPFVYDPREIAQLCLFGNACILYNIGKPPFVGLLWLIRGHSK